MVTFFAEHHGKCYLFGKPAFSIEFHYGSQKYRVVYSDSDCYVLMRPSDPDPLSLERDDWMIADMGPIQEVVATWWNHYRRSFDCLDFLEKMLGNSRK